jgi:hypothetical protein
MKNISWRDLDKGDRKYFLNGTDPKWPHPWKVSPFYAGDEKGWMCSLRPGFVNGESPLVTVPKERAEENPEWVVVGDDTGKTVDVAMWDDVAFPMQELRRRTGTIPQFFAELGVKDIDKANAKAASVSAAGGVKINISALDEAIDKPGERILWWTEVFLSKARATLKLDVDIEGNVITGNLVEYTAQFDTRRLQETGSRARIRVGTLPRKSRDQSALERMQGNVGDVGEDYLLVATIYLLSPPLEEGGVPGDPDGTWQSFVAHEQFWNLCHESKNELPKNLQQSGLDPFLVFFVGRYVTPGAFVGVQDATMDSVLTALRNNHNNEGYYWSV